MKNSFVVPEQPIDVEDWMVSERLRLLKAVSPWIGRAMVGGWLFTFFCALQQTGAWQLWSMVAVLGVGLAAHALARAWQRQRRLVRSSYLIIGTVLAIALAMALLFEELLVAYGMIGLLLVLLASVLVSLRAGYSTALIFTFIGVAVLLLQDNDILTFAMPTNAVQRNVADLTIFVLAILLGVYIVSMNQGGTRRALKQLIRQSNDLRQTNEQLHHEIGERKQAEAALNELMASLEVELTESMVQFIAEREKSTAILRSVGDAICMTDMDLRIEYINEAFTAITGYAADEIGGQPIWTLIEASAKDRQTLKRALAESKRWQQEIVACRKDGRTYDAEITAAPVRNANGERIGYVFSHQDITRFKNLDRARSRFIANVSHELRTPVTAIKLSTHLLRKGKSQERQTFYLDGLQEHTIRLETLIQDVLEIAVWDSAQTTINWEVIRMPAFVLDLLSRYKELARAREIALSAADAPEELPTTKGDKTWLARALDELVENALNFTPAGGAVNLGLEAVVNGEQHWVVFSVADTGPGIPLEEQVQLFERFFRGKAADGGNIPGSGLGLSLTHEIVRAHGGKITVESQEGHGSTFRIWLPAVPTKI